MKSKLKWSAPAVAIAIVMGCAGADGAVGPTGPPGPTGPTGAAGQTRITLTGTLDATGSVSRTLPPAAGSTGSPPLMACYQLLNGAWATEALGGQRCVIGNTVAPLNVAMVNGQPLAQYAFVVVY